VRIISPATLKGYAKKHPRAAGGLSSWQAIVRSAEWKTPQDVKGTLNSVDTYVTEKLRRTLYIFNICGGDYRLICAIHFSKNPRDKTGDVKAGRVYVREFLTHAEYDQNKWKVSNDKG
jgi:mRNA interferase HigB